MRIVVAGGTGFLGTALVSTLRADGHDIDILTRRRRRPGDIPWPPGDSLAVSRASHVTGDWKSAVTRADVLINLAGEGIADRRWTSARKHAILESRIQATRALVSTIRTAGRPPTVLINASAIGFYGTRGDEPLTEDAAPGTDFLASLCRTWEAEANQAQAVTRVVLLRTGVVLSNAGGALPQLARPFRLFAGGRMGSGRQYMSWIHLDDWVSMVRWTLREQSISGPINVTAPEPVRNSEFATALGRVLHRPSMIPAPAFALRIALGEMADAMILGGQRVLPRKAETAGFQFRYRSLDTALRAIYG